MFSFPLPLSFNSLPCDEQMFQRTKQAAPYRFPSVHWWSRCRIDSVRDLSGFLFPPSSSSWFRCTSQASVTSTPPGRRPHDTSFCLEMKVFVIDFGLDCTSVSNLFSIVSYLKRTILSQLSILLPLFTVRTCEYTGVDVFFLFFVSFSHTPCFLALLFTLGFSFISLSIYQLKSILSSGCRLLQTL